MKLKRMRIKEFATKHRLRVREFDGELLILCAGKSATGRDISHIYEYSGTLFGAIFFGTARTWGNARRAALGVGCTVRQNGNNEGTVTFDPADEKQVKVIFEWWRVKRKR